MLRILIIIFALNTFAPPATAAIVCEMMDTKSMVAMDHMSDTEINCGMHDDLNCTSTECITSCATNTPPLVLASVKTFKKDWWHVRPQYFTPPLHYIFLPVKNPPPLV